MFNEPIEEQTMMGFKKILFFEYCWHLSQNSVIASIYFYSSTVLWLVLVKYFDDKKKINNIDTAYGTIL